jgi:BASS family bile acid:Na+ symporter
MESVQHLVPLVLAVSLGVLAFSIGLDATLDDVTSVLRQPLELAKAVGAVFLAPPLVGAALIAIFPLSPTSKAALMLMAVSPVPPLVPSKAMKTGARRAYAYGVYTALVVMSVLFVPLMVNILGRIYGDDLQISPGVVARKISLGVLLPLAIGLAVRARFPQSAQRWSPIIGKIALALVILPVLPLLVLLWPKLSALMGDGTVAAAMLLATAGLAAGYLLGGPDPHDRSTLAVTAAIRHPGIAVMIATANAYSKQVSLAIVLMLLAGFIVVTLYQTWVRRQARGLRAG